MRFTNVFPLKPSSDSHRPAAPLADQSSLQVPAMPFSSSFIAMTASDTHSAYLDRYAQFVENGDAEQALAVLQHVHAQQSNSAQTFALLGALYMQLDNPDAAETAFIAALDIEPTLAMARFRLGLLQFTMSRPQTAFQTWRPLDALGEQHYLVSFKRAFKALSIHAFEDAILLLRQGLESNDENTPLNHDMHVVISYIDAIKGHTYGARINAGRQFSAATQFVPASNKQNL